MWFCSAKILIRLTSCKVKFNYQKHPQLHALVNNPKYDTLDQNYISDSDYLHVIKANKDNKKEETSAIYAEGLPLPGMKKQRKYLKHSKIHTKGTFLVDFWVYKYKCASNIIIIICFACIYLLIHSKTTSALTSTRIWLPRVSCEKRIWISSAKKKKKLGL